MHNKFLIPEKIWNRIEDQDRETFNQLYGKCLEQKQTWLNDLQPEERSQITPALTDKIMAYVLATAVQQLHHA